MGRATASPSIPTVLFLGGLGGPDLQWTRVLSQKAREAGFTRVIEPCCGSFVISCVHKYAGWQPGQIEASDVSLFSAIVGCVIVDRDLATIGYKKDGVEYALTGDPLEDAAGMIFTQAVTRAECKGGVFYWQEFVKDLTLRRDENIAKIKASLQKLKAHLQGISFRPICMFDHLAEVVNDPKTFIHISPPTYTGGYEKLYNTDGRITWNEPKYALFDVKKSQDQLVEESAKWAATLVCLQEDPPGQGKPETVYARTLSRTKNIYFWSNRPDEIAGLMGGKIAVPRSLPAPKPSKWKELN